LNISLRVFGPICADSQLRAVINRMTNDDSTALTQCNWIQSYRATEKHLIIKSWLITMLLIPYFA